MSQSKPNRMGLYLPFIFLLVGGVLYTFYWMYVAQQFRVGVRDWIDFQRLDGVIVDYAEWRIEGYPYKFTLTVDEPILESPDIGWRWEGEKLQMVAMPWNLNRILARIPGENRVSGPDQRSGVLTFDDKALAGFTFVDGFLNEFSLSYDTATLSSDVAAQITSGPMRLHLRPMPERAENLQIAFQLQDLTLGAAIPEAKWLGNTLENIVLFGEITGAYPALQQSRVPAALAWRSNDGTVDIRRSEIDMGPLNLGMKGKISFDGLDRPEGLLQLRIDRADELRAALQNANAMTQELQSAIGTLELLSADNKFAPIQLKEGGIYLAGQRLGDIAT